MTSLPTGTVTFFFSDIEGSTPLVETLGPEYTTLLERHHRIVRDAFNGRDAVEVGTEGDSFFAVFLSAADAVTAAVDIQRALAAEEWPRFSTVRVRIGLHTGDGTIADGTYVGLDVHRAARIMAAAHGGQVLMSEATRVLADRGLDGIELRDLGEHRLRGLSGRERLFQVVTEGLATEFPPPLTLDAIPNNLPTQASELVGREEELHAIYRHLDSANVRLLTLTGPGGIGKTRLALQAAADRADRFRDGVYFVDLSAARHSTAALQTIVETVGVAASGEAPLASSLAKELRIRQLLLLLDNFEQVMPAANDVSELLSLCPKLKVLVTSREALRVRGEQLFPVAPLSLPNGNRQTPDTAEEVSRYEAVRLFVERAQKAVPSFALTDDNAAVVAEICTRLDGLPLAIELATARLKLFSPEELRDRLRSRLEMLRGGARDLPERQRTLRSTIEWGYELLDAEERAVFQLLSVFPSARIHAVEEVSGRLPALAEIDVLDRLESLVDKSLVRTAEEPAAQRLSMLDTIREYAAGVLEGNPELSVAARAAHAEYFAEFSEARSGDIRQRRREVAVEALASELDNLQVAWRHFVDAGDIGQLNKMLDSLWTLNEARGWYHGAVALTNDLLDILSKSPPAPERAEDEITLRISLARGLLALRGYTEEVERLYREALAVTEAAGAVPRRLPVLRSLASFHLYRGEIDKTLALGQQILELADEQNDPSLQVEGHLLVGPALAFMGDVTAGLNHLDQAIELFDPERDGRARFRLGPSPGVAARAVSGLIHWLAGFPDTAARLGQSAITLAVQLGHPYSLAYATFHVTLLDVWNGRPDLAHERAGQVLKVAEEHDYQIWRALGLVLRGVTTSSLGDPENGLAQTERGIALYENLRTPPVFWTQILGLRARACAMAGRFADAVDLLDQAAALEIEGTFDSAAVKVQKADLLVSLGDAKGAESVLRRAVDEAGVAGARMIQLIAATHLARLDGAGSGSNSSAILRELYETFTEGFDTPHLKAALAALER